MNNQDNQAERSWGVRINTSSFRLAGGCPTWANPRQREKWEDNGLILWDHEAHQITRLSATYALQLLNYLGSSDDWKQSGLTVGEPAVGFNLNDPKRETKNVLIDQMELKPAQLEELFELLQSKETALQQMSEAEEKERRRRLALVYDMLLEFSTRQEEEGQADEIASSGESSDT